MTRQSLSIAIEEHGGDRYPDLEAARRAALRPIVADVAATLRALLAAGVLTVRDGRVIVKDKQEEPKAE
jgi:ribosomal protein S9